jgi:hypothetical protein
MAGRSRSLVPLGIAMLLVGVAVAATGIADAQRRPRTPPPVPYDATVQWTVFVAALGSVPAHRAMLTPEPGSMPIPLEGWQCTYSAPNRARLDDTNWSEVRTLECARGDALVSTTGFCQIAGPSWGARAGVLSLGVRNAPSRVQVTLDCSVVP